MSEGNIQTDKTQQGVRPCPQNCSLCSMPQQVFCSTRMLFELSREHQEMKHQLSEMAKVIADIQTQLHPKDADMQMSIPFVETIQAQNGSGAESRLL